MKLFGVTGGIGMGKSTVAQCLERRGEAVVDTDAYPARVPVSNRELKTLQHAREARHPDGNDARRPP